MERLFCPRCHHYNDYRITTENETLPVKGENITISASISRCCECDRPIYNHTLDDENLRAAYRIYRKKHNLLQSEEIMIDLSRHYPEYLVLRRRP
jgi:hypothetical protein